VWEKRLQLRHSEQVREDLQYWWEVVRRTCIVDDDPFGLRDGSQFVVDRLKRREYVEVLVRIYRVLSSDQHFDVDDARRCAQAAWEQEMKNAPVGCKGMERVPFMDSMFELIDVMTDGVTPDEYESFGSVLLTCVAGGTPPTLKPLSEIGPYDVARAARVQAKKLRAARMKQEASVRRGQARVQAEARARARKDDEQALAATYEASGMSRTQAVQAAAAAARRLETARDVEGRLQGADGGGAFARMSETEQMEARVAAQMALGASREEATRAAMEMAAPARAHRRRHGGS